MASIKKRVNLTVSNQLYDRLQLYRKEKCILSDASACLQLIVQCLNRLGY